MANAKRTTPDTDDKFDAYLRERFAELKRELDEQLASGQPKAGALRRFAPRGGHPARSRWTVGIAALLLAAVSIPLVIKVNRQNEQMRAAAVKFPPSSASAEREDESAEAAKTATTLSVVENSGRKRQTAAAERLENTLPEPKKPAITNGQRAQSTKWDAGNAGRIAPKEGVSSRVSQAAPAPAAPREAPGAEHPKGENRVDKSAASAAPAMPEVKARSAPIEDAQFRLKKAELAAIEKHEMEQLWKEYEKNPAEFSKDKRKLERLKLLLARHDTTRARRISTQ